MTPIKLAVAPRRTLALLMVSFCAAAALLVAVRAAAQDEKAEPAAAAPAADAPPADTPAAAQAPAEGAAAPAAAKAGQVEAKPSKSRYVWFLESSGLIGAVILGLSIYFVSTVSKLFLDMRQKVATPPELIEELNELLQRREFKEIYSVVKEDDSFFSRVVATGIAELPNGLAEARDAMERVGEAVTVEMERRSACWPCWARWGR